MSKDPSVLFYTSDFMVGTMDMTNEEVGMYIRLLCLQHQKGGFLMDSHMKFICGAYAEKVYSKFKIDESGRYFNERMLNEMNKRVAYCESRRNNLKKTRSNFSPHMDHHMENENKDVNERERREEKGIGKDRGMGEGEPREKGGKEEKKTSQHMQSHTTRPKLQKALEDFTVYRENMNKPFDDTTYGYFIEKLERLSFGKENLKLLLLGNAMSGGYPDIYPLSPEQQKQADNSTKEDSGIPKGKRSVSSATEYDEERDGPVATPEEVKTIMTEISSKLSKHPVL